MPENQAQIIIAVSPPALAGGGGPARVPFPLLVFLLLFPPVSVSTEIQAEKFV